ncbi:Phosphatidate cytidylyltransferase [Sulfitobacter noctilucicola]|uniref:Phosphatidate cytidylyltransferase n=1 Tax=Sulfitobacter noctilucicola TaxID=1342301 RepID=A0A7W6M7S0_9RHOB|nr:phosphatidate cytidylyltransferase [Sulfitobacter noctilucicola]KIN65199.1 Phosphatidate cytidylyltransferase [Sulfitobacter noctilucicola]MBB4173667.1 phosphatidate cytidylyltransferase [Sulfitobacter noctilucicola]
MSTQNWSDLKARMGAGAAMVVIGLAGIALGGHIFHLLVALICGTMVWELVGMLRPGVKYLQLQLGILTGLTLFLAIYLPVGLALPLLLAPAMIGFGTMERNRTVYMSFSVMILLAGYGMMQVRDDLGFGWMLWLVLVVVATDVVGYFAGRIIGGPKFWPAVSPKKTWAGTIAGWIGAAFVGILFSINTGAGVQLMGVSIAVSMASQMGDIAESGMKRKMGVKDSSNLIPGHGGLMDRFDGMLGAAMFLLVIGRFIGFPPGLG